MLALRHYPAAAAHQRPPAGEGVVRRFVARRQHHAPSGRVGVAQVPGGIHDAQDARGRSGGYQATRLERRAVARRRRRMSYLAAGLPL